MNGRPWTEEDDKFLIEHCNSYTTKELSTLMNRNYDVVRNHLYSLGIAKKYVRRTPEDFIQLGYDRGVNELADYLRVKLCITNTQQLDFDRYVKRFNKERKKAEGER